MGPVESVLAERIREYEVANLAARASTPSQPSGQVLSDIENTVTLPETNDPDAPREYDDDVVLHEAPSPSKPAEPAKLSGVARRTVGTVDY